MDFNGTLTFIKRFASELFLIVCGLVLIFFPNSAVALITKLMGWILVGTGIVRVIQNLNRRPSDFSSWLWTAGFLLVGFYLLSNPLTISELAGRILGLFLMTTGFQKLRKSTGGFASVLGTVTAVSGAVLFLLPKTLINTLLGFCGTVLIIIGAINLIDKLRRNHYPDEGHDSNIIDADV